MPLDILVKGDPGSLRATARWLSELSGVAFNAATATREAVGISESGWSGLAGEKFRARVGTAVGEVDDVAARNLAAALALDRHADDLDTVKSRIAQARAVAIAAGLTVTDTQILEPGGPPPEARPLPTDRCPTTAEHGEFMAAQAAATDFANKMKAYGECAQTVGGAGELELASQNTLTGYFTSVLGESTGLFSLLGLAADAVGPSIKARFTSLTDAAARFTTVAAEAPAVDAAAAGRFAAGGLPAQLAEALTITVGNPGAPGTGPIAAVVKSVPRVGVVITAAGLGYDIAKDPSAKNIVVSTAANGAGLFSATAMSGVAAGMMTATTPVAVAVAVPVAAGLLAGALVYIGVDKYGGDVYDAAKDAGEGVVDKAKEAYDATVDKAKDVAETFKDGAKKTLTFGLG